MFAVKVKKSDAGAVREFLLDNGLFDRTRIIKQGRDSVEIPVVAGEIEMSWDFEIVSQEEPIYNPPPLNFEEVKKALVKEVGPGARMWKGGWELVGDILIVDLPGELMDEKQKAGEKLLEIFPRVKTVLHRNMVKGALRRPQTEIIAGSGTETIHKENGCLFSLDPTRVMFSAGNMEERRRMGLVSSPHETVLDMFAGIGQFTIPMALHSSPEKIVAVEKRATTFGYLKANVDLNGLTNVETLHGDNRDVSPKGFADRVVMGYIFDMPSFIPTALDALKEDGGMVHYHDIVARENMSPPFE
jgi:tRNA wybutosine-synthesizing protein 2